MKNPRAHTIKNKKIENVNKKKKKTNWKKRETMKINGKTPSGLLKNFSQESYVEEEKMKKKDKSSAEWKNGWQEKKRKMYT